MIDYDSIRAQIWYWKIHDVRDDDMINETLKVVPANPIRDTLKKKLVPDKGIGRMKYATTSTMRGGKETRREKYDVT